MGNQPPCIALKMTQIHISLLWIAFVLMPIAGPLQHIGLLILGVAGVLGLPAFYHQRRFILAHPAVVLWLSWWLLAFLSLLWSPDPKHAVLDGVWGLLAIPAMAPILSRPRLWMWPLACGVAAQTAVQITAWSGLVATWHIWGGNANGGLHSYPPYVGLWAFVGLIMSCALILNMPSRTWRIVAWILAVIATLSIVLTVNRSSWAIAIGGLFLLAMRWAWSVHRPRGQWVASAASLLSLLAILIVNFVQFNMGTKFELARHNAGVLVVDTSVPPQGQASAATTPTTTPQSDRGQGSQTQHSPIVSTRRFDTSAGKRILWWNAGWLLLCDQPVAGHGAGSIRRSLAHLEAELPSEWGAGVSGFITFNPHASLVATAIEQGGIGVALLLGVALIVAVSSWRRGRENSALIGLGPAWIGLLLFSFTHAVLLEPYTSVLVSILLMASLPAPAPSRAAHPSR